MTFGDNAAEPYTAEDLEFVGRDALSPDPGGWSVFRLLATIATRDEEIARLREIAKAVAAMGMGMTDGLGRYCLMCGASADYDYPDVPGYDDAALTEYEHISAEREAACIAAIEHAADCAWIAARKLAGGVS